MSPQVQDEGLALGWSSAVARVREELREHKDSEASRLQAAVDAVATRLKVELHVDVRLEVERLRQKLQGAAVGVAALPQDLRAQLAHLQGECQRLEAAMVVDRAAASCAAKDADIKAQTLAEQVNDLKLHLLDWRSARAHDAASCVEAFPSIVPGWHYPVLQSFKDKCAAEEDANQVATDLELTQSDEPPPGERATGGATARWGVPQPLAGEARVRSLSIDILNLGTAMTSLQLQLRDLAAAGVEATSALSGAPSAEGSVCDEVAGSCLIVPHGEEAPSHTKASAQLRTPPVPGSPCISGFPWRPYVSMPPPVHRPCPGRWQAMPTTVQPSAALARAPTPANPGSVPTPVTSPAPSPPSLVRAPFVSAWPPPPGEPLRRSTIHQARTSHSIAQPGCLRGLRCSVPHPLGLSRDVLEGCA